MVMAWTYFLWCKNKPCNIHFKTKQWAILSHELTALSCLLSFTLQYLSTFFFFDMDHPYWRGYQQTFLSLSCLDPCLVDKRLKLHSDVWLRPANSVPARRLPVHRQSQKQITGVKRLWYYQPSEMSTTVRLSPFPFFLIPKLINSEAFLRWSFMTAWLK